MWLIVDKISFNQRDFVDVKYSPIERWSFTELQLHPPKGESLMVIDYKIIDNKKWVGVELFAIGEVNLNDYLDGNEGYGNLEISYVAVVRHPHKKNYFVHLLDKDKKVFVTFKCHEEENPLTTLNQYVSVLQGIDWEFEFESEKDEDDESPTQTMHRLIPNAMNKKDMLENQWSRKGWYYEYPDTRSYVESLASSDDVEDFFGWLFDDLNYKGCSECDLMGAHRVAYECFLDLFFTLEE